MRVYKGRCEAQCRIISDHNCSFKERGEVKISSHKGKITFVHTVTKECAKNAPIFCWTGSLCRPQCISQRLLGGCIITIKMDKSTRSRPDVSTPLGLLQYYRMCSDIDGIHIIFIVYSYIY